MSDTQAAWMRAVGATEASWDASGHLLSLKLGPVPEPVDTEDEDGPVKRKSADALAMEARAERRRIALGASGGPVRRIVED